MTEVRPSWWSHILIDQVASSATDTKAVPMANANGPEVQLVTLYETMKLLALLLLCSTYIYNVLYLYRHPCSLLHSKNLQAPTLSKI